MLETPWVSLVKLCRGSCHRVGVAEEESLKEIASFFKRCRSDAERLGALPYARCKKLTLPWCGDWYAPSDAEPAWIILDQEDERYLYESNAKLFELGIPTFLRESTEHLMKLFMSFEAVIDMVKMSRFDQYFPAGTLMNHRLVDEDQQCLDPANPAIPAIPFKLKQEIVHFLLIRMAETVADVFRVSPSNIVAVFDASGYCATQKVWRLSFRICFAEIAVTQDVACRVRSRLVEHLQCCWQSLPKEGWKAALSVPGRTGPHAAANDEGLWRGIVREISPMDQHALVFCDSVSDLCHERRPLLPFGLFSVSLMQPGRVQQLTRAIDWHLRTGGVRLQEELHDLSPMEWCRLGSTSTSLHAPSPTVPIQSQGSAQVAKALPAANQARPLAEPTAQPDWMYVTTQDDPPKVYYWNQRTQETCWNLPMATPTRAAPVQTQPQQVFDV
eukprot:TRINITY_DN12325_c0_g1_i1.p1 TRINITY_DN12325_c0_g1~~TRINITY_DN12325_c0_g1_i1.p1  ORF type:complete len:443 (+),score=66.70 TRINITY_DN12325_c0_g1_i1:60-1388(+)